MRLPGGPSLEERSAPSGQHRHKYCDSRHERKRPRERSPPRILGLTSRACAKASGSAVRFLTTNRATTCVTIESSACFALDQKLCCGSGVKWKRRRSSRAALHVGIRSSSNAIARTTASTPNITPAMTTNGRIVGGNDAANGGKQSKSPADAAKPVSSQSGRSLKTSRILVAVPAVCSTPVICGTPAVVEKLSCTIARTILSRQRPARSGFRLNMESDPSFKRSRVLEREFYRLWIRHPGPAHSPLPFKNLGPIRVQ